MGKIKIKGGDVYRASGILSSLNLQKADREIVISIYKNAAELKVLKKSLEDKAKEAKESVFSKIDEQRLTKVAKLREEYNSKDASQERKIDILNEIYLYKDQISFPDNPVCGDHVADQLFQGIQGSISADR